MTANVLRGMTWSHPRGYDPMVACSTLWRERTGVEIVWDKRSLQDFESFPVEQLARDYDLIVIDHPHVGQITGEGCLLPLDMPERSRELAELAAGSVGQSFPSYRWQGRQWALPIDAATQVQAWRPDLIERPAAHWRDVLALARQGRVLCPMRAPHSLMAFYTLTANLGNPCHVEGPDLVEPSVGLEVYERLAELASLIDVGCFAMDPIAVFEAMATPQSAIACAPLIYGYVSYAFEGFRPSRLAFADIPLLGEQGPIGSALGGTGLAVSARSAHPTLAMDFAFWIASGEAQSGPYAAAGGQPGHSAAWRSAEVNAPANNFYRSTRATLDGAWVRPRHDGYMPFQNAAAERLNEALKSGEDGKRCIADLNAMFARSFG
jgi:multiple sugar transport system substrate-binding protein